MLKTSKLQPGNTVVEISLACNVLISKRIRHRDADDRTKACRRNERVDNPLDRMTLFPTYAIQWSLSIADTISSWKRCPL